MRLAIAAILLLLAATPANAENWVRIGGDDKAGEYVDTDSLRRSGDEVRFRQEIRYGAKRAEGFDRAIFASVATCTDRKAGTLSMSFHLGDLELMSSSFREKGLERDPVEAGTPLERALTHVCEVTAGK